MRYNFFYLMTRLLSEIGFMPKNTGFVKLIEKKVTSRCGWNGCKAKAGLVLLRNGTKRKESKDDVTKEDSEDLTNPVPARRGSSLPL